MILRRLSCRLVAVIALGAVSAEAQTLVVLNKEDATAQLFDLSTGKTLAVLPTGNGPHEVAVSADGKFAVAADYGGSAGAGRTLTVIDLPTRTIARTIPFGTQLRPHGIRFLADNKRVVVTAERAGVLVTVDVSTGSVLHEKATGQTMGHMVAMSRDEKTAYVANITPGTLSIVDYAGSAEPVVVKVGTETEAINIAPDDKTVWMGSNNTGKVYVIDVATRKVIDSVQTKGFPYRVAFTPDSRIALVPNPRADEVQVIDAVTRKIIRSVSVAVPGMTATPFGIVLTADAKTAWVTLNTAARVVEFDIATGKVLRFFETGRGPDGIALTRK